MLVCPKRKLAKVEDPFFFFWLISFFSFLSGRKKGSLSLEKGY